MIRETAHAWARADRAMVCWTLGITEHHNGVDNVLSLINLALLCGHVGRFGSGLNPLRGQNNVQGGGDMGAIPNKLAGFQDIERDHEARARFEPAWGVPIRPHYGWHLTQMFDAMERGELRTALRDRREPGPVRGGHQPHAASCSRGSTSSSCRTSSSRRPRSSPTSCFPGTASWCESEGTVTNSERRVQRVRKALDPPGEARDDMWILAELARRLGYDWPDPVAEEVWDELRSLSPMHAGMSYARLEELGGHPVAVPRRGRTPARGSCTSGSGTSPLGGPPAPFSVLEARGPVEALDADFPIRLTTGRRLESYNTGVQTSLYRSPLHRGETLDLSPGGRRAARARGRRGRARRRRGAARSRRPCGSTRRCGPGSRS